MEVKTEKVVTAYDAKRVLSKINRERELGYEQKNAFEHLNKFCKLSVKEVEEFRKELGVIEKLQDRHKAVIMDLMPVDTDDLRLLFANERIVLDEPEKSKIITIVKKFAKGK